MKTWIAILSWCMVFSAPLYAASVEMSYEQYEKELAALQQREKNAKEQIAGEQGQVEHFKTQIADVEQKIIAAKQEIFTILGIAEQDVVSAETEIASIRQQLEILSGLPVEELKKRQKDIDTQQARIAALRKNSVSFLWKIRDQLPPIENLMQQVKSQSLQQVVSQPAKQEFREASGVTTYQVRHVPGNRETLYQIAARDSVYGDPKKWILLYRSNQAIIDKQFQQYLKENPNKKYARPEDLIFPGQVLEIPR
jgi:nucleoid-associated protein YgaU